MPSTARYRFEFRLFDWMEGWTRTLCGSRVGCLVAFREDGSVRRVYLAAVGQEWNEEQRRRMIQASEKWVLFLPGDLPGTGSLEWCDLPVEVVRRWLGRAFFESDFVAVDSNDRLRHWPESWRTTL